MRAVRGMLRGRAGRLGRQHGAIAQLGEHLLCKQGVVGSIPTGSTNRCASPSPEPARPCADCLINVECSAHSRIEAHRRCGWCGFFANLGRNMRLRRSVLHVSKEAKAKYIERGPSKATWGYMVKRISAHGGCLGGQRRRRTWQPAKRAGELATSIDPVISEWGNPPLRRYRILNT